MGNYSAAPGETVTVSFTFDRAVSLAGLQFYFALEQNEQPDPITDQNSARGDLRRLKMLQQQNEALPSNPDDSVLGMFLARDARAFAYIFGESRSISIPAGSVLLSFQVTIPEDAAPGTVYRFKEGWDDDPGTYSKFVPDFADSYPFTIRCGSITVTG